MSESSQYINIDKIFENSSQALKKDGLLMICDYFTLDGVSGEISKSGHNYKKFINRIGSSKFSLLADQDITGSITKTLDLGLDVVSKFLLALEILTEKIQGKRPYLKKIIFWLYRKKIAKLTKQLDLLDSTKFKENKSYRFILLQKAASS